MKVELRFNHTQEYEGGEIIYFPFIVIYVEDDSGGKKYWSHANYFISSLDDTDSAYRILKIINLYKLENMMRKVELTLWNDFDKAIIEESQILFKDRFSDSYQDKLDLDIFEKILVKWIEYLQSVNKDKVVFEIN